MTIDPSAMPRLRHGAANPSAHAPLPPPREPDRPERPAPVPTPPQSRPDLVSLTRANPAPEPPTAERDTAGRVLAAVAERALEHPPRDMHKLVASAAKFLLTNLEPALELARQVRQETAQTPDNDALNLLAHDRNSEAAELLLGE